MTPFVCRTFVNRSIFSQALSQDPNSLSNLDQDLPNNMIHQVAIKSLPQEWLWCQTWCNDETLSKAKTIDLCNNPLTKEAKLTAAQRIVPEWKDYDQEIKNLLNKVELGEVEHEELNESVKDGTDKKGDFVLRDRLVDFFVVKFAFHFVSDIHSEL